MHILSALMANTAASPAQVKLAKRIPCVCKVTLITCILVFRNTGEDFRSFLGPVPFSFLIFLNAAYLLTESPKLPILGLNIF